ncbi:MAG: PepSY domain-containing protein [Thermaerobacter sp.]|nr:PepSY domain-containing protein [Thermaerobacter sp.]
MKHLWSIMAAVAMTATPVAMAAAHVSLSATRAVHLTSASGISATAAGQDAAAAVGGGAVIDTSADTYQGQSVWDVHVLEQGQVWDVKVGMTGSILLKKLSSEQPKHPSSSPPSGSTPAMSAPQADALAIKAVGGGTATHTSTDQAGGVAVYDIHVLYQNQVWDVKVNQTSGAIVQKTLSSEQPGSGSSGSSTDKTAEHQSESGGQSISTPPAGVVFGQKMSAAPSAFQSWVTQAISQVHGVSLKWVKFQAKSQGGYQMNIKIHLAQGTTKVIDVFNAQGQLVSQHVSS